MTQIPRIDPSVAHVSLGQLRRTAADDLTKRTYVVNDGVDPLAVCVPYETFLEMQRTIEALPQSELSPTAREDLREHWRKTAGDVS